MKNHLAQDADEGADTVSSNCTQSIRSSLTQHEEANGNKASSKSNSS